MVEWVGGRMNFIKEHSIDMIAFIGIVLISIGVFILDIRIGFIVTGMMLVAVAYLMWR